MKTDWIKEDTTFFIWICKQAGDTELMIDKVNGHLSYKLNAWIHTESKEFAEVYLPFLLFKAVLGLNRNLKEQNWINIQCDCVNCDFDWDEESIDLFYRNYTCEEEAIVAGLKMFYEREKGNR